MNAMTIRKHLLEMGLPEEGFVVVGERTKNSRLRFFTVTIKDTALQGRGYEIKQTVLGLIAQKGFSGGCDVVSQGHKIA